MTTPEDPNQPPADGTPAPPPPEYGAPPPAYGAPPPPPAYGAPPPPPAYGTPPPAYAGSEYQATPYGGVPYGGAELAPWIYRVGGFLIDAIIIAVPAGVIGLAAHSRAVDQILGIIGGVIIAYLNGAQGQSPGKRIVGLKLVREQDGQLIGGGMGILRWLCHILDSLACLVGWFWPLWDSKKQTFADKIVGTIVIKV
jgi:uncharacterized RDD family membrane protein YckC